MPCIGSGKRAGVYVNGVVSRQNRGRSGALLPPPYTDEDYNIADTDGVVLFHSVGGQHELQDLNKLRKGTPPASRIVPLKDDRRDQYSQSHGGRRFFS